MNARQRDRRIADLQERLDNWKAYEADGIDPVTLKNLPKYTHDLPAAVPAKPQTETRQVGRPDGEMGKEMKLIRILKTLVADNRRRMESAAQEAGWVKITRNGGPEGEYGRPMDENFFYMAELFADIRRAFWRLRGCSHGPYWVDTSTAGPDSGTMSGHCERCGMSQNVILY